MMAMACYFIPLGNDYIVYRPLLPLAFVANPDMKSLIEDLMAGNTVTGHEDARAWLNDVGFWAQDNPPESYMTTTSPHTAVLLMTNGCNLRCTYCYANAGVESANSMPLDVGKRLIGQAASNAMRDKTGKFKVVFHGGGEPTTHWHTLTALVEHARALPIDAHLSMASNGVINSRRLKFIIDHFDELSISIDGLEDVQNQQRPTAGGSGSFAAVLKTLRALDAAKFRYGLRITVTPEYFNTLPDAVEFLIENTEAVGIQIEPAYTSSRGVHGAGTEESGQAFSKSFIEALEIGISKGRFVYYSGATPWQITDRFCRAATDALVGTPEGDLVGCFEVHDRNHALIDSYRLGQVASVSSAEAVQEPLAHDEKLARAFEQKEKKRKASCEDCFCFYHCAGDCSILRPDGSNTMSARCNANRTVTSEILTRMIAESDGIWRGQIWQSQDTTGVTQ